ncbi:MAG: SusC/RagA family TonB-linked outer membrane protein [Bacteroidales bacterium]|nr:SusC/RagA family TonB-linked outer membrane protein [Bacteroidales bacterium]
MRKKYIKHFIMLALAFSSSALNAQENIPEAGTGILGLEMGDSTSVTEIVDLGLITGDKYRFTGAYYTISGEELSKVMAGNLLNTLYGLIPGLTVVSGSGEPGYDNPTLYSRGISSWNFSGNNLLIFLDGFRVNLSFLASLSAAEIESVTYLKDAVSLAMYGIEGGSGVLSVKTKRGLGAGKTKISVNGRLGRQSIIELPTVLNAYDYTRFYNQACENDGLAPRYPNPGLYLNGGDATHPDVNWYNEVLKDESNINNLNMLFNGGTETSKYFVFMDYTGFSGFYKDAGAEGKGFGSNAEYNKFNLRGNVDINLTKSLTVSSEIVGSIEDKNTPAGFTAGDLFDTLMVLPSAAFSVRNPDQSWGNSTVYAFNPVQLLRTNGIWNSHTRGLQTNFKFEQKLDIIAPGLALTGGLSFSNQYVGFTRTYFTGLSYELLKDDTDQPILDTLGNYTYTEIGSISDGIDNGVSTSWNRQIYQLGLTYNNNFGLHSFSAALLANRMAYTYYNLVYAIRNQGVSLYGNYAYNKRYIASLTLGYTGSADFEKGSRYGLFPAIGFGWIASDEAFLANIEALNFLKVRATYGLTGNTNANSRFLFEQKAESNSGWLFTAQNSYFGGRREGAIPNNDFTWEKKSTVNIGIDAELFEILSVNLDLFSEKRTHILEDAGASVPGYTGFRLQQLNSGEVKNKGIELVAGINKQNGNFGYHIKGLFSFARNKITQKAETAQPYDRLYEQGYRIDQFRGLVFDGFYQESDFDANGFLLPGVVASSFATVRPGDLKFVDQTGDNIINEYDYMPIDYSELPEITGGLKLGFNFKGLDAGMFLQAVTNRTVSLPFAYTHPFVNNSTITAFSENPWTPATASTATSPRLTTQVNLNNNQETDFYMRNGSFVKLRYVEIGYSFNIRKIEQMRIYLSANNLFTWDKIDDLEAENLSTGYPLSKTFSIGLNVKF